MLKIYVWLTDLLRSERGQDMVEYALITAVISIAIIVAVIAILAVGALGLDVFAAFDTAQKEVGPVVPKPAT